jgi:hypothetical protein
MTLPCFQSTEMGSRALGRYRKARLFLGVVITFAFSSSLMCLSAGETLESTFVFGTARTIRAPEREHSPGFFLGSFEYRLGIPNSRLSALACFEWRGSDRYITAGLFFKVFESDRLIIGIGSGPGFFNNGRFTLGNRLEFRSVAEVQIKLSRHYRLGLDYCHYSNGGTGSINPGAESVRLFLAIRS